MDGQTEGGDREAEPPARQRELAAGPGRGLGTGGIELALVADVIRRRLRVSPGDRDRREQEPPREQGPDGNQREEGRAQPRWLKSRRPSSSTCGVRKPIPP